MSQSTRRSRCALAAARPGTEGLLRLVCSCVAFVSPLVYSNAGFAHLVNADFERELGTEWKTRQTAGVAVTIDDFQKYSGHSSLRIDNYTSDTTHNGCSQQLIPLPPGTWLHFSIAIRTRGLHGRAGLDVHFRDAEDHRLQVPDASIILYGSSLDRDWGYYHVEVRVPPGTDRIVGVLFLKGQGTVWFDDLRMQSLYLDSRFEMRPSAGAKILKGNSPLVWYEHASKKVYRTTVLPHENAEDTIRLYAAQNESEAFQLVIVPEGRLYDCTLRIDDLVGTHGGILSGDCFDYHLIGYVGIEEASVPNGVIGQNPDFLLPRGPFAAEGSVNTPVWVQVCIPSEAEPDDYCGSIILVSAGRQQAQVPIRVHIYDFRLPEHSTLEVKSHFDIRLIRKYDPRATGIILPDYYRNLRDHRINVVDAPEPVVVLTKDGVVCDFQEFDKTLRSLMEEYGFRAITTGPFLGDATGWAFRLKWMGMDIAFPEFAVHFKEYCRQLERHLDEQGWLDRCYLYFWDEPPITDVDFDQIVGIAAMVKEAAPRLNVFMTKWPIPELFDLVDVWCVPFTSLYYDAQEVMKRRVSGEKVYVYHNDPYIDRPLLDTRLCAWRYWSAGVDGVFAWWNITKWLDNPYENPHVILPRNDGSGYPLKPGNGVLLYPNPEGAGPPANSLRWEVFRDGLEDYEYLCLLRKNLDAALTHLPAGSRFSGYAHGRACEYAHLLVQDFLRTWIDDPQILEQLRLTLAQEIVSSAQRPYIVINATKSQGSPFLQIEGITEKRTVLAIEGHRIDVDDSGYFTATVEAPDSDYLNITAVLGTKVKCYRHRIF